MRAANDDAAEDARSMGGSSEADGRGVCLCDVRVELEAFQARLREGRAWCDPKGLVEARANEYLHACKPNTHDPKCKGGGVWGGRVRSE